MDAKMRAHLETSEEIMTGVELNFVLEVESGEETVRGTTGKGQSD